MTREILNAAILLILFLGGLIAEGFRLGLLFVGAWSIGWSIGDVFLELINRRK